MTQKRLSIIVIYQIMSYITKLNAVYRLLMAYALRCFNSLLTGLIHDHSYTINISG
jgi:hypothetical protein